MTYNATLRIRVGPSLFEESQMAADIFAKLGDIKGESLDSKHKEEIEVLSFSWGVSNAGPSGSGGTAGKATFRELTMLHKVDKASPVLMKACATGQHLPQVTITQRKAGKDQHDYLIIKMNDVIITSVSDETAAGQPGSETVALAFSKVHLEHKVFKADGSATSGVHFKYDVKAQKEG
jgi:type VI secretion system secreted protein Hcp